MYMYEKRDSSTRNTAHLNRLAQDLKRTLHHLSFCLTPSLFQQTIMETVVTTYCSVLLSLSLFHHHFELLIKLSL